MKRIILGILASAFILSIATPAQACYLCKVRDRTVKSVRTEAGRGTQTIHNNTRARRYHSINVKNKSRYTRYVAIRYKSMSGSWITRTYQFSPYETAYLVPTKNSIFYVAVSSKSTTEARRMVESNSRTKLNMGTRWVNYTVNVN